MTCTSMGLGYKKEKKKEYFKSHFSLVLVKIRSFLKERILQAYFSQISIFLNAGYVNLQL